MARRRGYDHDYFRYPFPTPWGGYYPPTSAGGGMVYGLEGGGWAPYVPYLLGYEWEYGTDYRLQHPERTRRRRRSHPHGPVRARGREPEIEYREEAPPRRYPRRPSRHRRREYKEYRF